MKIALIATTSVDIGTFIIFVCCLIDNSKPQLTQTLISWVSVPLLINICGSITYGYYLMGCTIEGFFGWISNDSTFLNCALVLDEE